jgi:hypothetical protein
LDTVDDLVLLLLGNQRTTTQIEFGAQQVVLVRNEDAREALPEELRAGLVMTIFEAKGLEFDDVILYNFFADSPAEKEWICVNSYNDEEHKVEDINGATGGSMLRKVDWSELEEHQSQSTAEVESTNAKSSSHRRREFNTEADRLLNSELKHLYTAVTRPRVNLWIFDEHNERRGPMFRFLKRRGLCEMIDDIDTATEEGVELFAKTSTGEDWLKQGRYFLQKRSSVEDTKAALHIAVKCFKKAAGKKEDCAAEALAMRYKTEAHIKMMEVNEVSDKTGKRQTQIASRHSALLSAALACMRAGVEDKKMSQSAAVLLHKAREYSHAAAVFKGLHMFEQASKVFSDAGDVDSAVDCAVQMRSPKGVRRAIKLLRGSQRFDDAIVLVQNHWAFDWDSIDRTAKLEELARISAKLWHKKDDEVKMKVALKHLPVEQQLQVLKKSGRIEAVVDLLEREQLHKEAAEILLESGRAGDAAEYMRRHLTRGERLRAFLARVSPALEQYADALVTYGYEDTAVLREAGKEELDNAFEECKVERPHILLIHKAAKELKTTKGRSPEKQGEFVLVGRCYLVEAEKRGKKTEAATNRAGDIKLFELSVELCKKALNVFEEVDDRIGLADTNELLGRLYADQIDCDSTGNTDRSATKVLVLHHLQHAMALYRELDQACGVEQCLKQLQRHDEQVKEQSTNERTDLLKWTVKHLLRLAVVSLKRGSVSQQDGDDLSSGYRYFGVSKNRMDPTKLQIEKHVNVRFAALLKDERAEDCLVESQTKASIAEIPKTKAHELIAKAAIKSALELLAKMLLECRQTSSTNAEPTAWHNADADGEQLKRRLQLLELEFDILSTFDKILKNADVASLIKQHGLKAMINNSKLLAKEETRILVALTMALRQPDIQQRGLGAALVVQEHSNKLTGRLRRRLMRHQFQIYQTSKPYEKVGSAAVAGMFWGSLSRLAMHDDQMHDRYTRDALKLLVEAEKQLAKKGATLATQGFMATKQCSCRVQCDTFQCRQPQSFCRFMHMSTKALHATPTSLYCYARYTLRFLHNAVEQSSTLPPMMDTIALLEAQVVTLLCMGRSVDTQQGAFLPKSYSNWHLQQPRLIPRNALIRAIVHNTKSVSVASIRRQAHSLMNSYDGLCRVLTKVDLLSDKLNSRGVSDANAWERGLVLALVVLCNAHGGLRSSAIQLVSQERKVSLVRRLRQLGRWFNAFFP